jgi:hypothetical protein
MCDGERPAAPASHEKRVGSLDEALLESVAKLRFRRNARCSGSGRV